MKVGILTFHASHNYGSMLQAYALQQTVLKLGHECEIINLRTAVQKSMYKPFYRQKGWVKKLKAIRYPKLAIDDARKHRLFEKFLEERLILTPVEYHTAEELKQAHLDFDAYISGSDQIWNTICFDYISSYYLDFVKLGKRIAYAPSMGPIPEKQIEKCFFPFIKDSISHYDAVSVREEGTAETLKKIVGKEFETVVDPTLLINSSQWSDLAGNKPIIDGDYIFLYTPWVDENKELYDYAAKLASQSGLKVISTLNQGIRRWGKNKGFSYHLATGPIEFLNLLKYARFVLSASFHAVVFSIIFGKTFYAYKGMEDSRISSLLKIVSLEQTADVNKWKNLVCDNNKANISLCPYISKSLQYLKNALNG